MRFLDGVDRVDRGQIGEMEMTEKSVLKRRNGEVIGEGDSLREIAFENRADLWNADLGGADLGSADLTNANLRDANLGGADLRGADIPDISAAKCSILPDEGDVIGWKKAYLEEGGAVLVKLRIPDGVRRSNATGRKCRAEKAVVLEMMRIGDSEPVTEAHSGHDYEFLYRVGDELSVPDFDENRWEECAPGIHFFITKIEAIKY